MIEWVIGDMERAESSVSGEVYLDGLTNVLAEPEFAGSEDARRALRVLEERPVLQDLLTRTCFVMSCGSPPHAGTGRALPVTRVERDRITPARGDGTTTWASLSSRWSDHPRTRGRDAAGVVVKAWADGSPPHAGTGLGSLDLLDHAARITATPSVIATTSVTTSRPAHWETPLGIFDFRRIQVDFFYGYRWADLGEKQQAFIASPEKALLDLVYLEPGGDRLDYLAELRLSNFDRLDWQILERLVMRIEKPKLLRAFAAIRVLAGEEGEFESL